MIVSLNEGAGAPSLEMELDQMSTLLLCLFRTLLSMPMLLRGGEHAAPLGS